MEDYRDDPDVALMLRVAEGDDRAFTDLVLKYQKLVFNTIYRIVGNPSVAEELSQDAFVRVYRAAAGYRPEARFSTWLFIIVRNLCRNYHAREGKLDHQFDPMLDADSPDPASNNPEQSLIRKELRQKVQEAIEMLPESLKLPLVLHQFSQLSYEEVAEVLDLSLSAVKVRIHRARLALVDRLKPLVEM